MNKKAAKSPPAGLTVTGHHGFQVGDEVVLLQPDRRWLPRFWNWLLKRSPPTREIKYKVTNKSSSTSFDIKEK